MANPPWPKPNNKNICKVTMLFHRDTRVLENQFFVYSPVAWTDALMLGLNSFVMGWWNDAYKAVVPTTTLLFQVQYRKLDPTDPLALDHAVSPEQGGTRAGVQEAANVTNTISWRTGKAGKAYRGRIYVPGLIEGDVSADDRINSGQITAEAAAGQALISAMVANGLKLAIFHRPLLVPKPLDNLFDEVISVIVENIIDSQRRRLPGRGR